MYLQQTVQLWTRGIANTVTTAAAASQIITNC